MTSHHLRQLRDLLQFTVVSEGGPLGKLAGLLFDPADWTIRNVIVAERGNDREPIRVPVRFFRSIVDERRELCFDVAGEVLLSHGDQQIGGLSHSALIDAASVLGRSVAGCDDVAGSIDDLIVNIDVWQLRYLVVRTDAGRVLTDVEWCSSFDGDSPCLMLDLPAEAVTGAPPYKGLDELCIGYEELLYRHYTSRKHAGDGGVA